MTDRGRSNMRQREQVAQVLSVPLRYTTPATDVKVNVNLSAEPITKLTCTLMRHTAMKK